MRLLFDQNLSPLLVGRLWDLFPDSVHVRDVGLKDADDREVWSFASKRAFIIATKDSDFNDLSFLHGFPPFVVWLNIGNCTRMMLIVC